MLSPLDITGCSCWLKAGASMWSDAGSTPVTDGGAVYQWNDQSGNGRHWTQTSAPSRPKWNATDGLVESEYNATGQQFLTHATFPFNWQAGSIFLISTQCSLRKSYAGSLIAPHYLVSYAATPGNIFQYSGNDAYATRGVLIFEDSAKRVGSTLFPSGLSLLGYAGGASSAKLVVNDDVQTLSASTNGAQINGLNIGVALNAGLKHVVFYDHQLNSGELSQIFAFAEQEGVYVDQEHNIVIDGDSITHGAFATLNRNWVRRALYSWQARASQYAMGENALRLSDAMTLAATEIDIYIDPGKENVLIVFLGTNDIANGASGATTYNNLVTYCQARYSAGWDKICVVTMLPREAITTARTTYNQAIRDNALTDWDAVADWGDDATMGQDGDQSNTTYYTDEIHPTDAGHAIGATIIRSAVGSLIGATGQFGNVFLGLLRAEV